MIHRNGACFIMGYCTTFILYFILVVGALADFLCLSSVAGVPGCRQQVQTFRSIPSAIIQIFDLVTLLPDG